MKSVNGRRFCRLLESRGWHLRRVNGSHHIYAYARAGLPDRISVPVHGNRPLKLGLQRHLMKLPDIDESAL